MFLVFLLNPPGLWKLCAETDTKIDSQHTVKKVLDFAKYRKIPNIQKEVLIFPY